MVCSPQNEGLPEHPCKIFCHSECVFSGVRHADSALLGWLPGHHKIRMRGGWAKMNVLSMCTCVLPAIFRAMSGKKGQQRNVVLGAELP